MKSTLSLAAILPFLASSAVAQSLQCQTAMGVSSVKNVPTSTVTTTNVFTTTQLLARQSTTTLYKGTIDTRTYFVTDTDTTTLPTTTDTATITTTSFLVQTIEATSTTTSTTTNTNTETSTSTTINPAATGFRNIWDTLNNSNYNKRRLLNPHAGVEARAVTTGKQGVQKILASAFPTKVVCTKVVSTTSTKTAYTTLPKSTSTIMVTTRRITSVSTLTVTSTIIPDRVTSTEVDTSTSTVQTTTTTTQTDTATAQTTTTEIAPGPTYYSACSNPDTGLNGRNYFGPGFTSNGVGYYAVNVANNGPGVASDFQIVADGAASAEACCVACQQLSTCETFIFRSQFKNCFLLNHKGASCSNPSQHPNFILSKKTPSSGSTSDGYLVGNGNCGYTWSGNSDGSVFRVDGA